MDNRNRLAGDFEQGDSADRVRDGGSAVGELAVELDATPATGAPSGVEFDFRLVSDNSYGFIYTENASLFAHTNGNDVDKTGKAAAAEIVRRWNELASVTQERDNLRAACELILKAGDCESDDSGIHDAIFWEAVKAARKALGPQEISE